MYSSSSAKQKPTVRKTLTAATRTCVSASRLTWHGRATLATRTPVEILARANRIFFEEPFRGEVPEPSQESDDCENLGENT